MHRHKETEQAYIQCASVRNIWEKLVRSSGYAEFPPPVERRLLAEMAPTENTKLMYTCDIQDLKLQNLDI